MFVLRNDSMKMALQGFWYGCIKQMRWGGVRARHEQHVVTEDLPWLRTEKREDVRLFKEIMLGN